jgi:hypothetical protein
VAKKVSKGLNCYLIKGKRDGDVLKLFKKTLSVNGPPQVSQLKSRTRFWAICIFYRRNQALKKILEFKKIKNPLLVEGFDDIKYHL